MHTYTLRVSSFSRFGLKSEEFNARNPFTYREVSDIVEKFKEDHKIEQYDNITVKEFQTKLFASYTLSQHSTPMNIKREYI